MSELGQRFRAWATARHLTQFGIVLAVVWLIVIGSNYLQLTDPASLEATAVKSNVAGFGLLFAVVFHFFGRDRTSLVITIVTLVALAWFELTGGTDLPGWMSLDWLFPGHR